MNMNNNKSNEFDEDIARELLKAGWSVRAVADKLGTSIYCMYRYARSIGWDITWKHRPDDILGEHTIRARELLESGSGLTEVADELGVSIHKVDLYARHIGWDITWKHDNKKLLEDGFSRGKKLLEEGLGLTEVADELGVSLYRVNLIATSIGWDPSWKRKPELPFDKDEARKLLEEGWTCPAVAQKLNVDYIQLYNYAKRNGWRTSGRKFRKVDPDMMVTVRQLVQDGLTATEIADSLGLSQQTLRGSLARENLKPQSWALKDRESKTKYDEAIIELHKKGKTQMDIAKQLGTMQSYVSLRLKALGITEMKKVGHARIDKQKVMDLRKAGMSHSEIAKELGCIRNTVTNILLTTKPHRKEANIKFI